MSNNPTVTELTDDTFEGFLAASERPVLVDYWATWCGPCKLQAPVIDALAAECSSWLAVAKVDVEAAPLAAADVKSVPTLALFVGGTAIWSEAGAKPKTALLAQVRAALAAVSIETD